MNESYKHPEGVTEQQVIEALNTKGVEDAEARALLEKYVDQCHAEADMEAATDPSNPEASNRANIKADIKIAILYSKTEKYLGQALGSLDDALRAALQNESTHDLAEQINLLFDSLNS